MPGPDKNDPQVYSCEKCGQDVLEAEMVEYGNDTFCSQECADEFELEQADEGEDE